MWEDNEEMDNWEDFDPEDLDVDFDDLDELVENVVIHANAKLIYPQVTEILEAFYEKFGYSLRSEVESKTFIVSYERGYLAAYFTPVEYNRTEKYYTLVFNPNYKSFAEGWQYSLDFTDSFLDESGAESMEATCETLIYGQNIQTIIDEMINHWKSQE